MNTPLSRREFLRRSAWAAAGIGLSLPTLSCRGLRTSRNETLLHASIGAAGMAGADIRNLTRHPALKLVAVADVDLNRTEAVRKQFPDVKVYQDWRELLDKEKSIDSVNVSVPDHMHAPIAMSALQLGKHVYCQKPLTHDIYETRRLTQFAHSRRLVTQMGIQIHSETVYRRAVRMIQDGAIGKVKEVHAWSGKNYSDAAPLPERQDPVPAGFDWDLWLGIASARPFIDRYYHPGIWRRRLDFGTGTFGDMGCHIYDPVFGALKLTAPVSVRSEGPAPNPWNWAADAVVHYVFPGTRYTAGKTVRVTWYDGAQRPSRDVQALLEGDPLPGQGSIFIGTKGVMLLPHIAAAQLYPIKQFEGYPVPALEPQDHWLQFVDACRGQGRTSAGFDYSGPLTEAVLLGSVACRFPMTTLQWNARRLRFDNLSDANQYIRRPYRAGWEVKGLS